MIIKFINYYFSFQKFSSIGISDSLTLHAPYQNNEIYECDLEEVAYIKENNDDVIDSDSLDVSNCVNYGARINFSDCENGAGDDEANGGGIRNQSEDNQNAIFYSSI